MREALVEQNDIGANINGYIVNNLRFADDIDLLAETIKELQKLLNKVDEVSTKYGQEISETKTEWMCMQTNEQNNAHQQQNEEQLLLNDRPLKKVEQFKYLGATITENGQCTKDISIRTATALSVLRTLDKVWKSTKASIPTKIRLYKSLVQPIALYGCEAWTLRKEEENMLLVFEMTALRRIMGVSLLDKIRNEVIRERLGVKETIVELVGKKQTQWLGHVLRMKSERIAKITLQGKTEGKRRQGGQRKNWPKIALDRIPMTMQKASRKAEDRVEWRVVCQHLGVHVDQTT